MNTRSRVTRRRTFTLTSGLILSILVLLILPWSGRTQAASLPQEACEVCIRDAGIARYTEFAERYVASRRQAQAASAARYTRFAAQYSAGLRAGRAASAARHSELARSYVNADGVRYATLAADYVAKTEAARVASTTRYNNIAVHYGARDGEMQTCNR